MSTVREYRTPLAIAAGTLVVALLLWAILISPQKSKLTSLQTQESTLQTQQTALTAKLTGLKEDQQQLSTKCADLETIATQIPTVQNPTDIDAEESSFESQFNGLTSSSGVSLSQFSGFTPATSTSGTPATTAPAGKSGSVVAVPTTLAVTGNYGQILSFVNGLDSFPRLFVIQNFTLAFGTTASTTAAAGATTTSASTGSGSAASSALPPLWIGGTPTSPAATPYSLAITGSIYYTTTPNALDACTKATAQAAK
jgi:Tfp pilus assembly protein PilO